MTSAWLQAVGAWGISTLASTGRLAIFALQILWSAVTPPYRPHRYVQEIFNQGALSAVIITVSGLAVGMVLGLQGYNTLVRFGAEQSLGAVVGLSLLRELGPVLTALLVTGRAGSATAAEIASMVVTEQINGLRMMSVDPISLVVTPKALAMTFVMPLLASLFSLCGIFGAYLVGVRLMGLDGGIYLSSLEAAVVFEDDIALCLLKALIFGALVGLIATFRGYFAAPTAVGVSTATTSTVVTGSVTILIVDYLVTAMWGVSL